MSNRMKDSHAATRLELILDLLEEGVYSATGVGFEGIKDVVLVDDLIAAIHGYPDGDD